MKEFDFFISHASHDKLIASTIADGLRGRGYHVWIDAGELTVGERLLQHVNLGLTRSRCGVVLLSRAFFDHDWPQWELEGLLAIENAEQRKVVLPVWHGITLEDLVEVAPLLAGRLSTDTSRGMPRVIDDLVAAFEREESLAVDHSTVPELVEILEREPLDFYADAEEELERRRTASDLIAAAKNRFTTEVNEFNASNQSLAKAGQQLGQRELRAHINRIVPIFDAYSTVLREQSPILGETIGRGLLLVARGLVADHGDTRARREQWLGALGSIERVANESLALAGQSLRIIDDLQGRSVAMKHAKARLLQQLQAYVSAHHQTLADIQDARRLLNPDGNAADE